MRNIITVAFACVALALIASAASAEMISYYNPGTGAVTFDNGVEPYFGIRIDSNDGSLIFANGDKSLGGYNTGTFASLGGDANFMEWGNLTGFTLPNPGSALAGMIMPAGLTQLNLDSTYTVKAVTLANTGAQVPIDLRAIPEPTTLGLAGLGLIGLVVRRRR